MYQPSPCFTRIIVTSYFAALGAGFWLVEWRYFSALSFVVVLYAAIFFADFLSGLIHLFIDYYPLNYQRRLNELFFYAGDRSQDAFNKKRQAIFKGATFFDKEVYHFKVHHRNVTPLIQKPYSDFFYKTGGSAAIILLWPLALLTYFESSLIIHYAAFFLLIVSVGTLYTDIIHSWAHGSKTMPWGVKTVAVLRKMRLMYSAETHLKHHQHGVSGFCFITGHSDFLVDKICRWLLVRGLIYKRHWHGER
jgi:hypothetical protein